MNGWRIGVRLLHLLPPEVAHALTLALLACNLLPPMAREDAPELGIDLWGLHFSNPIGLAAGFDKNAEVIVPMLKFGFGFVETGTVTPRPQAGNARPRLFRWTEAEAVINRLGFNNEGLARYCQRLDAIQNHAWRHRRIVGANIGRNKDSADAIADYVVGLKAVAPLADYIAVNISSPNTVGLRGLQNRAELTVLLTALQSTRSGLPTKPPMLVKLAPDLDDAALQDIAEVAMAANVDGLIISNTTIARPENMPARLRRQEASQLGGLSGPPLFARANHALATMYRATAGALPLIGVGGVASAADAYQKIRLGASLVQLYTALIYQGPVVVASIKTGLAALLRRDGFSHVRDAVGLDAKKA